MRFALFLTACALILPGCASSSVKKIRYGATPAEVLSLMGKPDKTDKNPKEQSETWLYRNLDEGDCAISFELGRVLRPPRCSGLEKDYLGLAASKRKNQDFRNRAPDPGSENQGYNRATTEAPSELPSPSQTPSLGARPSRPSPEAIGK